VFFRESYLLFREKTTCSEEFEIKTYFIGKFEETNKQTILIGTA